MNTWLVRAFPHNIKRLTEFRNRNLVAIGWPGIGDLQGKTPEEIKRILSGAPYHLTGTALGDAYATVNIFVNRMKPGDLILVPDGADIFFAEISSDYFMDPKFDNDHDGYPHQRRVKWLQTVERKDLSMPLRSSLKVHRTVADLIRHRDEIAALANGADYTTETPKTSAIAVSYPIRKDFTVSFEIPEDITKTEARRLAQYLETLYFAE